jgi:hypothetical protein
MPKLIAALIILTLCTGCAKRVPRTDTFVGQNLKVGTIQVTALDAEIGEDRNNVFDKVQGESQIKNKLDEIFTKLQMMNPSSDVALNVQVDHFRLRHGATRYFTGFFSGSDQLEGTLTIMRGSQLLLTKRIEVAGGNGNPFNISRQSRAEGLVNGFSNSILHALRNDTLSPSAATTQALPNQAGKAPIKTAKSKESASVKPLTPTTGSCSLEQVLSMKGTGLTDAQIRAACRQP